MIESADVFVALRTSDDPTAQKRAAHDEASDSVWIEVINKFPEMREWVAHNKTVPVSVLTTLANDSDPRVRWSVAIKRKLTPDLFDLLSRDEDETVRARIAQNPNTPADVRDRLLSDSVALVQDAAARH